KAIGHSYDYNFFQNLEFNLIASFIASLTGGCFLVFYSNVKFRDKPYGQGILVVAVAYIVVFSFIALILGFPYVTQNSGITIHDPRFMKAYTDYLHDTFLLKNFLVW